MARTTSKKSAKKATNDAVDGKSYVGRRVAKDFGGEVYHGKVAKFAAKERLWAIEYDDGDAEEMDWDELAAALALHDKANNGESKKSPAKAAKKAATPAQKEAPAKAAKKVVTTPAQKKKATPAKEKKKATPKSTPKSAPSAAAAPKESESFKTSESSSDRKTASAASKVKQAPPPAPESKKQEAKKPEAKKAEAKTKTPEAKTKTPEPKKPEAKKKKAETVAPAEDSKPAAKKAKTTPAKAPPAAKTTPAKPPPPKAAPAKKPAPKPKKLNPADEIAADPRSVVQRRIAKNFDGVPYFGTVIQYDDAETPAFWHVEYDDGDQEDYSEEDMIRALKLYATKGKKDPNRAKGKK